ncbi:unnamed protein product [Chrysoparadoxa australica]
MHRAAWTRARPALRRSAMALSACSLAACSTSSTASSSDAQSTSATTKRWWFYSGKLDQSLVDRSKLVIFGGSSYPELAHDICELLGTEVGAVSLGRYADGECNVEMQEQVEGKEVFIVTNTNSNDGLVELLLMVSAAKRASAQHITAVLPFYGYARQDRRFRREPLAAADVALMLEAMGVDRVLSVDMHSSQIQGFFSPDRPVDNIMPLGVASAYFAEIIGETDFDERGMRRRVVVVAPQEGQVARAHMFKEHLRDYLEKGDGDIPEVAIAFVARSETKARDEAEVQNHKHLIGDVAESFCILVDDLVDTGGTIENAVGLLKGAGAQQVAAFASHGRFSKGGLERVVALDALDFLVVTNTLPHRDARGQLIDWSSRGKVRQLSLAPLLAESIKRAAYPELVHPTEYLVPGSASNLRQRSTRVAANPEYRG